MTVREKIGQRLVGGFPGTEMSPEFIRLVKEYKISNVILFQRNAQSTEQLARLCRSIQDLVRAETGHGAFICIDQEGGAVTRLPPEAVNVPGAMALAATGDEKNAEQAARLTAKELRAYGINFDLAPVADINNNPDNPIIGVRSYGDTAERVSRFACAAARGYMDKGVLCCAKHFPGHGDTAKDSHVSLPLIDKSSDELEALELRPFRALVEAGCPAVMTTHILFPQLEPDNVPATMSRRIITGLLKERIGFDGLVVSDCMEMAAIAEFYGSAEGTVAAMAAGVDLIFICHTAATMEKAMIAAAEAYESGRLPMAELDASVEKILALKEKYCAEPVGTPGGAEALAESMRLRQASVVLYKGSIPPLGEKPFFCGCADYRAGLVANSESNADSFADYFAQRFGGDALVTGKEPTAEEIARAAEAAKGHSAVFVCTFNAHLIPGQQALVDALGALGIPMAVVALHNPYDLRGVPAHAAALAAWDYSPDTLAALAPILSGEAKAQGVMPVALEASV